MVNVVGDECAPGDFLREVQPAARRQAVTIGKRAPSPMGDFAVICGRMVAILTRINETPLTREMREEIDSVLAQYNAWVNS